MRAEIDRRAMALLSGGHLATDFSNGALPALLPFMREKFALSYTLVGALVLASQASSSLIQPLFGLWSDRRGAMWLLPVGVALAGVGIGLAADAPSYWLAVLLVLVAGVGVAAFHPEGSKFAGYVSGRKRASGMSWFSIGGNLGYALGPIATTAVVASPCAGAFCSRCRLSWPRSRSSPGLLTCADSPPTRRRRTRAPA